MRRSGRLIDETTLSLIILGVITAIVAIIVYKMAKGTP